MDEPTFWIAYHGDWSGFAIFDDELPCLRYAVDHHMAVAECPFGQVFPQSPSARQIASAS